MIILIWDETSEFKNASDTKIARLHADLIGLVSFDMSS